MNHLVLSEGLRLEILGHWLAAPARGRTGACSSYEVSCGRASVLLDCGPGTVPLLQERDKHRQIEAVVLTHMDPDHVLDLVPLASLARSSAILCGRSRPQRRVKLYVPREDGVEVLAALEAFSSTPRVPAQRGSAAPQLRF